MKIEEIFYNGNVIAKTIRTVLGNEDNWHYFLEQIINPKIARPVKPLDASVDRTQRYNCSTECWEQVKIKNPRGAAKETVFTKKMSATLLPQDGQINLYKYGEYLPIGLLFDVSHCRIKEKYIFNMRVNTDSRFWLKGAANVALTSMPKSIGIAELKKYLLTARQQDKVPDFNELLVGFSEQSVVGVFFNNNSLHDRLAAYRYQALVKERLGKTVPVVFISSYQQYQIISQMQTEQDLDVALLGSPAQVNYSLATIYRQQFERAVLNQNPMDSASMIPKEKETAALSDPTKYQDILAEAMKSILANKAITGDIKSKLSLVGPIAKENKELILLLAIFGDSNFLLDWIVDFDSAHLAAFMTISIATDVARVSGEEMWYVRKIIARCEISYTALIFLYQNSDVAERIAIYVSNDWSQKTLEELRKLRQMVSSYRQRYEWDSYIGKKVSEDDIAEAYKKYFEIIYIKKKSILVLDTYEEKILAGMLIRHINDAVTVEKLMELHQRIACYSLVPQSATSVLSRFFYKQEASIKSQLNESLQRAFMNLKDRTLVRVLEHPTTQNPYSSDNHFSIIGEYFRARRSGLETVKAKSKRADFAKLIVHTLLMDSDTGNSACLYSPEDFSSLVYKQEYQTLRQPLLELLGYGLKKTLSDEEMQKNRQLIKKICGHFVNALAMQLMSQDLPTKNWATLLVEDTHMDCLGINLLLVGNGSALQIMPRREVDDLTDDPEMRPEIPLIL